MLHQRIMRLELNLHQIFELVQLVLQQCSLILLVRFLLLIRLLFHLFHLFVSLCFFFLFFISLLTFLFYTIKISMKLSIFLSRSSDTLSKLSFFLYILDNKSSVLFKDVDIGIISHPNSLISCFVT